jgi:tRNA A-37 threonylcarbamoyl transferase component Bud32
MIDGFRELHAKKFLFVDVKPDNFMMKGNKLFFVDYGIIEKYIDITTGRHRELNAQAILQGTPAYSSLAR